MPAGSIRGQAGLVSDERLREEQKAPDERLREEQKAPDERLLGDEG